MIHFLILFSVLNIKHHRIYHQIRALRAIHKKNDFWQVHQRVIPYINIIIWLVMQKKITIITITHVIFRVNQIKAGWASTSGYIRIHFCLMWNKYVHKACRHQSWTIDKVFVDLYLQVILNCNFKGQGY